MAGPGEESCKVGTRSGGRDRERAWGPGKMQGTASQDRTSGAAAPVAVADWVLSSGVSTTCAVGARTVCHRRGAQRGADTCPKAHSWGQADSNSSPRLLDSRTPYHTAPPRVSAGRALETSPTETLRPQASVYPSAQ